MPAVTHATQFKLTDSERARLDELGRLWGSPDRPLTMADVVRRMMWHPWEAEAQREAKPKRKEKRT